MINEKKIIDKALKFFKDNGNTDLYFACRKAVSEIPAQDLSDTYLLYGIIFDDYVDYINKKCIEKLGEL